jgi:hypothetical protein
MVPRAYGKGTMSPTQRDPEPWRHLSETFAGYLTARARGLLASELVLLDREGARIGKLEINGSEGADLRAGDVEARIERVGRSGYAMLSSGEEILTSTGDPSSPGITSHNQPYETTLSLLRNKAEAGPAGNTTTVRINGGLTNRSYKATFEPGDKNSLPVTLFLLYRLVSLRRKAYVTGG